MMEQITLQAYAKINLTLDIIGRRTDGYHELDTVMQSVSLADTVQLTKMPGGGLSVRCDNAQLPQDKENIAYRAAMTYFETAHMPVQDVSIVIRKQIPSQAGLGGGSADAAATLIGLCTLFGSLPTETLLQAGASIGADVPFCLTGGCLRARGIGELLSPLPLLPECTILIAKPAVGMSTADAYAAYDRLPVGQPPYTNALIAALSGRNLQKIGAALDNVFAKTAPLPAVEAIRTTMHAAGAAGACMSGSGTAVFALFADEVAARRCAASLSGAQITLFICQPIHAGCIPIL
ncbi:MAG: 4-(cytidine 5'-diphospho)-2-C-methyl-D-erythritol kinase [Ethanoligenens sp.]